MAEQQSDPGTIRTVTPEEVERDVEKLLTEVRNAAEDIKKGQERSTGVRRYSPSKPDASKLIADELRRVLEAEVVVTPEAEVTEGEEDYVIRLDDFEREIAKKALVSLKVSELRQVATELGIDWRGNEEELAERIGAFHNYDEESLARLILDHEDEPRPERGVADRIFGLLEAADEDAVAHAAESLVGHYVRVGVARWFIFESVDRRPNGGVALRGTFRAYRAEAHERDDRFEFATQETSGEVSLAIVPGGDFVVVRSRNVTEASGAMRALERTTGIRHRGGVTPRNEIREGELLRWDLRTLFMLDLLDRELDGGGIAIQNLTSVHFEMDEGRSAVRPDASPRITSVRIEGDHVASSPQACQLIVARRALVGATFWIRFRPVAKETYLFPVRISLAGDRIEVLTGFGTHRHELARDLQRAIVARILGALRQPVQDSEHLRSLAARITARARQSEPAERADILGPRDEIDEAESFGHDTTLEGFERMTDPAA